MPKYGIAFFIFCLCLLSGYLKATALYGDRTSLYGNNMPRQQLKDDDKDGVINHRDRCPNTPHKAEVNNYGCHQVVPKHLYVELKVLFASDSHEVRPIYFQEIKKLADFMRDNPDSSVVIEGHTDTDGHHEYNLSLSSRRAKAIEDILVHSFLIKASRVKHQGFGETQPIRDNATEQGKRQNRRVVAEISIRTLVDVTKWDIYTVDSNK